MRPGIMVFGAILLVAGMLGMAFGGQLGWAGQTSYLFKNDPITSSESINNINDWCRQEVIVDFDAPSAKLDSVLTYEEVTEAGSFILRLYRFRDGSWQHLDSMEVSKTVSSPRWHQYNIAQGSIIYDGDELKVVWMWQSGDFQWALSSSSGEHMCEKGAGSNQMSLRIKGFLWEEEEPPPPGQPTANFKTEPDYLDVKFISTSTPSEGETLNSWVWDFGDGNDGLGETITHSYDEAGNYTVKLTVTQTNGEGDHVAQTITVTSEIFDPSDPYNPTPINPGEVTETTDEVTGMVYEPSNWWILWVILIIFGILLLIIGVKY